MRTDDCRWLTWPVCLGFLSNIANPGERIHLELSTAFAQQVLDSGEVLFADSDVFLEFRPRSHCYLWLQAIAVNLCDSGVDKDPKTHLAYALKLPRDSCPDRRISMVLIGQCRELDISELTTGFFRISRRHFRYKDKTSR